MYDKILVTRSEANIFRLMDEILDYKKDVKLPQLKELIEKIEEIIEELGLDDDPYLFVNMDRVEIEKED